MGPLFNLYIICFARGNIFRLCGVRYMQILLATRNHGKVRELRALLKGLPFEVIGLEGFPHVSEIEETGNSFSKNARIKASGYALQCGVHTLAEDSGLEVAALGGKPGVHSARYAGKETDHDVKIAKLLSEFEMSRSVDRSARFVSHVALADRTGKILFEAEGICDGTIANEARGENGFGYDPIFIPDGYDQTLGELSDDVKNSISHRAAAIAKIIRYLRDFA